jgi:hypothetical protein
MSHMDRLSVNYYSPQRLQQHQVGVEIEPNLGWVDPIIRYYPGVGRERDTSQEFVHDAEVVLRFRLGSRTFFEPYYSMIRTPTYRRNTYNVLLTHRF